LQQDRGNTDGFLAPLRNILYRFKGVMIELWVDHAHWHKGERMEKIICQHSQLVINYIPKYHPEVNLQEQLWRTIRYEETTNTYYDSFEDLVSSVFKRSQPWRLKKIVSLSHHI